MSGRISFVGPPLLGCGGVANFIALLLALFPFVLHAQTDSLPVYDLAQLKVTAEATVLPNVAPVSRIGPAAINRYDGQSLLAGFNQIPGARFEERAPGSYRISIRGSSLRAPFGVRNVKVYWNGIPYTEPGGDTPLNFLDPINTRELIVFKGPAGSLYGSGVGGAILLKSIRREQDANYDEVNLQGGSFGTGRLSWLHRRQQSVGNFHQLSFAHQRTDGYRAHSQLARSVGELGIYRRNEKGHGSSVHVLATDLHYELPGGLNPEQFAENPRQARSGSEGSRAAINYRSILTAGRFYGSALNELIDYESSIYATANVFDHPFNFDHKREENLGVGGRSVISHARDLTGVGFLKIDLGLEAQLLHKAARNYEPNAGQPADLNFVDDIDSRQLLAFLQGKLNLKNRWSITTGLSLQQLTYQVDRTFNADGTTGKVNSDFAWVAAPRISIGKEWDGSSGAYTAFASYGRAYSPPSLTEFRTNEGSLNADLEPERGNSYEMGFKRFSRLGFNVELNVYYQQLGQSITTFQDENDVQLFRNAGGSRQFGIETVVSRELLSQRFAKRFVNSLDFRVAHTYQNGKYQDYRPNGNDFSNQPLPGLTPSTFDWQLTARSYHNIYFNLGLYTSSRTPLNDANDVFAESFAILRAKIGHTITIGNRSLEIYAGGDNLLDQTYSLGYDLNPQFGRRYFQPAAGRAFFVGAKLRMK